MAKKNLSQIAKKVVQPDKKVVPTKTISEKIVPVVPNVKPEIVSLTTNERDEITKKTVEDLLSGVNVDNVFSKSDEPKVDEPVIEVGSTNEEVEWLEEQVLKLNQENEDLRNQLNNGGAYTNQNLGNLGSFDDNFAIQNTIALYNKIQDIYDNLKRVNGELIIYPKPFLVELESYFPYLSQHRRRLLDE